MYKRLETVYCGPPRVVEHGIVALRRGEVLLRTEVAYLGEIDRGIASCLAMCFENRALGTTGCGRVIDVGIGVDPSIEGRRVVVKPFCRGAPIAEDGYAQELAVADSRCVEVVPPAMNCVDAVLAEIVAAPRELLEELESREVLLVGRDASLIPYAVTCVERSSRCFSIPRETPLARDLGLEAVSTSTTRVFDVVVIGAVDPFLAEVAVRACREGGIVVAYPPLLELGMVRPRTRCRLEAMKFGNLRRGSEVLSKVRNIVLKRVKTFEDIDPYAAFEAPALLNLGSSDEKSSKRRRR